MSGWRDGIFEGTWRGQKYLYKEVKSRIGRRTVLTELPGKDAKPVVEDMGPATNIFTLDLFVMGEDYDVDRDALRKAFNTAGPGKLVHPYWGPMDVTVHGEVDVTETTAQGGKATFHATFVQDGAELELVEARPTDIVVIEITSKLTSIAEEEFDELSDFEAAIASVFAAFNEAVQAVSSAINKVQGKIAAALQAINNASAAITAVSENTVSLLNTPKAFAAAMTNMFVQVVSGITDIGVAYQTAFDFFEGEDALPSEGNVIAARARVTALYTAATDFLSVTAGFPVLPSGTAQQQRIKAANQAALQRLTRVSALTSCSQIAVTLDYESFEQAQKVREALAALIDQLVADDELSDNLYGPLCNLRAALTDHFARVGSELPEIIDYKPGATLPVLVVAYRLYGDSTREVDILARNPQIRDPSALPADDTIQVIADE